MLVGLGYLFINYQFPKKGWAIHTIETMKTQKQLDY